ncbi:DUF6318 family protein [Geodermatophilus marinus]|uniref:DUF6318 family protein n=1 Tax=Geodermatophilus sp. LHW52908 TaxID=2303986 RepID=UPI000E3D4EAC|nr:DUF6318 family protein [Geodermatophilus sp. LHW52908]RFU21700.1 hypothetical protein D0Z06_08565 [Geodermatophilus sp. LHW52908]
MTLRGTRRVAACLLVGSALLGGCSGGQPASGTLPEVSPSAPETEAALEPLGPADLPMPDEARTQDAAGAQAFVRYYIALINRTSTVMDAAPLREFSSGCQECDRIASNTEADHSAGLRYGGGEIVITEATQPLISDTRAEMAIRVDQDPLRVIDSAGEVNSELSSEAYRNLSGSATVVWDEGRDTWLMSGLSFE